LTLDQYVTTFGQLMRERYGERVQKLALNVGLTCPNIDGSLGHGGCTFCNNSAFSPFARREPPLATQITMAMEYAHRLCGARRFIAYFQAYTNTYGEVSRLEALWRQALASPDIIGISVGTRPDCVPDAAIDVLCRLRDEGHEVWLELGLQSAFDETLRSVNRGHGWAAYEDAVQRARGRGLQVCTHLILGLPGEGVEHWQKTWQRVMTLGTDGVKLHPLHVVKNTRLAHQWRLGEYQPLSMQTYIEGAANLIADTPADVAVHRVTATAPADILLAPEWCLGRWPVINGITRALAQRRQHGTGLSGR